MVIKDIMTKEVASLNEDDTVERAAELMLEHDIGSIPVCSAEKVIGIVTDRDIALRTVAKGENPKLQPVRSVMSSNPVLGNPQMEVKDAARIMSERQIRRLPVADGGRLIGIVSLGDIATNNKLEEAAKSALTNISEPCCPVWKI